MAEEYDVRIKVISQKGKCTAGHRLGDEWTVSAEQFKTPGGVCLYAFSSLLPMVKVLMYGGSFKWAPDADSAIAVCPDPDNPVIFEMRRLRE